MKTILLSLLHIAIIALLFFSCQKEVSFEFGQVSEGSLVKDINNNCLPATINGNYIAGKDLDGNNYIEVQVNVSKTGNYSIGSDTVNGYSFNATGNFKDTGSIIVKLIAHGKPGVTGNDHFQIVYGTSSCDEQVTVLNGANTASFTLPGAPGACLNDSIMGGYVHGIALDTGNHVLISVNVTIPGTYNISTGLVNGYSFSASGSFSTAGIQTVDLIASGIPVNAGTDVFTVMAGSSSCSFSISVLTPITTTNNDLFPLTMSSYWNYDDLLYRGNIVKNVIIDTVRKAGNLYNVMEEQISPGGPLQHFYRKTGDQYFEYTTIDRYTGSVRYKKNVYVDLPFLKDNPAPGEAWQTPEYSDTATFDQVIIMQYNYTCLAANVSAVINGNAFNRVYKIEMRPTIRSEGNGFGPTGEVYTYWYARGIGLIFFNETNLASNYGGLQIRDWQVN